MDVRDCAMATWKDVVMGVIWNLKGEITNESAYSAVEGHKRAATNVDWKAKVRQTLQFLEKSGLISRIGTGRYALAVA